MKNLLRGLILLATLFFLIRFSTACSPKKVSIEPPQSYKSYLTSIHPDFMVEPDKAYQWHRYKDKGGPTHSGDTSWQRFMTFLEKEFKKYGVVDITKNKWTYDRWYTSEGPEDKNWTLLSDGTQVKVAHYGAYSGSTGPDGIAAEMLYYTPASPPASIKGKIAVFTTAPHPNSPLDQGYQTWLTINDHEYLSDP